MNQPDPLIRRLTDRLGADPELQMEVARELQTHLDDATAEFRAAGDLLSGSNADWWSSAAPWASRRSPAAPSR
jgi:hypothetical protein